MSNEYIVVPCREGECPTEWGHVRGQYIVKEIAELQRMYGEGPE